MTCIDYSLYVTLVKGTFSYPKNCTWVEKLWKIHMFLALSSFSTKLEIEHWLDKSGLIQISQNHVRLRSKKYFIIFQSIWNTNASQLYFSNPFISMLLINPKIHLYVFTQTESESLTWTIFANNKALFVQNVKIKTPSSCLYRVTHEKLKKEQDKIQMKCVT